MTEESFRYPFRWEWMGCSRSALDVDGHGLGLSYPGLAMEGGRADVLTRLKTGSVGCDPEAIRGLLATRPVRGRA